MFSTLLNCSSFAVYIAATFSAEMLKCINFSFLIEYKPFPAIPLFGYSE